MAKYWKIILPSGHTGRRSTNEKIRFTVDQTSFRRELVLPTTTTLRLKKGLGFSRLLPCSFSLSLFLSCSKLSQNSSRCYVFCLFGRRTVLLHRSMYKLSENCSKTNSSVNVDFLFLIV